MFVNNNNGYLASRNGENRGENDLPTGNPLKHTVRSGKSVGLGLQLRNGGKSVVDESKPVGLGKWNGVRSRTEIKSDSSLSNSLLPPNQSLLPPKSAPAKEVKVFVYEDPVESLEPMEIARQTKLQERQEDGMPELELEYETNDVEEELPVDGWLEVERLEGLVGKEYNEWEDRHAWFNEQQCDPIVIVAPVFIEPEGPELSRVRFLGESENESVISAVEETSFEYPNSELDYE